MRSNPPETFRFEEQHHDEASAQISLLVGEFLAKNNTLMLPQPPYSPVTFLVPETEEAKIENEPKHVQAKQPSKFNQTFKIATLVGTSEGYEYQHNATKKSKFEYTKPAEIQNSR